MGDLATLGGQLTGRLDHVQPAHQDVVDRIRGGRSGEAEGFAELRERGWILAWAKVEIAAEHEALALTPLGRAQQLARRGAGAAACGRVV